MPLLIVFGVGVAVIGYYLTRGSANALASTGAPPALLSGRNIGPVPGTVPPGSQLPGQGASGAAPNTSASIIGSVGAGGAGLASLAAMPAGITALGAATVGIGVVVGVGLALWMAHLARVKGAKDENAVLNELVPNFSKCLIAEFDALNSGKVTAAAAIQDLETIRGTYWAAIAPYQKGPGQHTHPCSPLMQDDPLKSGEYAPGCIPWKSASMQTTPCDKTCTAGCCVGCDYVEPAICSAKYLIQSGGGAIKVHAVGGSKYGYTGQAGFTLVYTPTV
jgi:hypothetical protein